MSPWVATPQGLARLQNVDTCRRACPRPTMESSRAGSFAHVSQEGCWQWLARRRFTHRPRSAAVVCAWPCLCTNQDAPSTGRSIDRYRVDGLVHWCSTGLIKVLRARPPWEDERLIQFHWEIASDYWTSAGKPNFERLPTGAESSPIDGRLYIMLECESCAFSRREVM